VPHIYYRGHENQECYNYFYSKYSICGVEKKIAKIKKKLDNKYP
jgi:hypothetical protein